MILVLNNIRSVYNVGSIFRTADAAGVEKIYLVGYTPSPLDRFGNPRKDFIKVSLGAEHSVPWTQTKTLAGTIKTLKGDGYTVAALEQAEESVSLFSYTKPNKFSLVLGNEVRGLSPAARKHCDVTLEIPMRGIKESLNVSVAAGVALFTLTQNA